MRTPFTAQRGSVVLVALCLTIVLGIAVAGYVALCARTMVLSNRSFCYASSTQLAETGLEEALWALNKARSTPGYTYTWPGWTIDNAKGTATKDPLTGFATNKGVPGVVNVRVEDFASPNPTITAHGISQMPDGIAIDKELKIKVRPAALFSSAVGAYQSTSYTIHYTDTLDSYNSLLGDYSEQTPTDQAIVCAPNVSVNAANILGYVATMGSAPIYTTPGTVKGLTTPAGVDRDPSRISTNANQNLFDILSDLNLPGGTDSFSYYLNRTQLTRYYVNDLTLAGSDLLRIEGPVIIVVSGNLSIQDTGSIVIAGNGSAQIIVSGSIDIRGSGVDNQTKLPKNLGIFRRGSAGSYSTYFNIDGFSYTARLETSVPFYGVIYDPYGSLVVSGPSTIYGSLVANVVAVDYGNAAIHYDLDLRHATFSALITSYDIAQWLVN